MLETKTFKFVRNPLWPKKSILEISDSGINNKGKLVKWEDITEFAYHLKLINGSPNYTYTYKDQNGKRTMINMVALATAKKAKKALFEEIYWAFDAGFKEKVIAPRAQDVAAQISNGESVTIGKCILSMKGIEIRKGIIKKEPVLIAWDDVVLTPPNQGVFGISSAQNKKDYMGISYELNKEARMLEGVLQVMTRGLK